MDSHPAVRRAQARRTASEVLQTDLVVGSPNLKEKAFNWTRAATISTGMPMSHKAETAVSSEKRDTFHSLELELLMSEFLSVAASKEEQSRASEEEPSTPTSVLDPGAEESQWLSDAGLGILSAKILAGEIISEADLREETTGFTNQQVKAIKQRVNTLNLTVKRRGKDSKNSSLKEESPTKSAASAWMPTDSLDDAAAERLTSLTDNLDDPPTSFFDLSDQDVMDVKRLEMIQATSILEASTKTSVKPFKEKKLKRKKGDDAKTFGVELEILLERDNALYKAQMLTPTVPLILSRIIEYMTAHCLHEEGIFRKAGSAARIVALRKLCDDAKGSVDFAKQKPPVVSHDISALLKQFLRELPEPLLTSDYIELFTFCPTLEPPELRLYTMQLLLGLLPMANRQCLRILIDFLALVASQQEKNMMTIANLTVVFAPTLFYVSGKKGQEMSKKEVDATMMKLKANAAVLHVLLEHHDVLWNVPSDILAQMRFVIEQRQRGYSATDRKDIIKLLAGKPAASTSPAASGVRVMWVQPNAQKLRAVIMITKDGLNIEGIQVFDQTTVGSILENMKLSVRDFCLTECGGNICRRRLNNRTRLLPLLKVNPIGALVIAKSSDFPEYL